MVSCNHVRTPNTFFLRIGVRSFDGVRDFNADLCKNIETTSVCSIDSNVVVFFIWGRGGLRVQDL